MSKVAEATGGVSEDLDDGPEKDSGELMSRRQFSKEVNQTLEELYVSLNGATPSHEVKHEIALSVNKTPVQIHAWWYRRQRRDRVVAAHDIPAPHGASRAGDCKTGNGYKVKKGRMVEEEEGEKFVSGWKVPPSQAPAPGASRDVDTLRIQGVNVAPLKRRHMERVSALLGQLEKPGPSEITAVLDSAVDEFLVELQQALPSTPPSTRSRRCPKKEDNGFLTRVGRARNFSPWVRERLEEYFLQRSGELPGHDKIREIATAVGKTQIQVHQWWYRRRSAKAANAAGNSSHPTAGETTGTAVQGSEQTGDYDNATEAESSDTGDGETADLDEDVETSARAESHRNSCGKRKAGLPDANKAPLVPAATSTREGGASKRVRVDSPGGRGVKDATLAQETEPTGGNKPGQQYVERCRQRAGADPSSVGSHPSAGGGPAPMPPLPAPMPPLSRANSLTLSMLKFRHAGRLSEEVVLLVREGMPCGVDTAVGNKLDPGMDSDELFEQLTKMHMRAFSEYTCKLQEFCWKCWFAGGPDQEEKPAVADLATTQEAPKAAGAARKPAPVYTKSRVPDDPMMKRFHVIDGPPSPPKHPDYPH